jgi:hypothetical protein
MLMLWRKYALTVLYKRTIAQQLLKSPSLVAGERHPFRSVFGNSDELYSHSGFFLLSYKLLLDFLAQLPLLTIAVQESKCVFSYISRMRLQSA